MNHDVFRVLHQSYKNIIIVNAVGESNAFPNSKRRNCGKNSIKKQQGLESNSLVADPDPYTDTILDIYTKNNYLSTTIMIINLD